MTSARNFGCQGQRMGPMPRGALVTALAALFAVALFTAKPALAMPISAPAGLAGAAAEFNVTENVACSVVWRCGYYGCGWRRVCWAPYYGGYGYYRPHYGYRPYYGYRSWYRPYYGYRWGYRRYW